MKAQITSFVQATYENEPPAGNSFRFKLWSDFNDGEGWTLIEAKDAILQDPIQETSVEFMIGLGNFRVTCRRMNTRSEEIGPEAVSESVQRYTGTYEAPATITLSF